MFERSTDLQRKGRNIPPYWVQIMAARQRKTLVVCRQCHMDIHAGNATQRTPTNMETRSVPGTLKSVSPVRRGAERIVPIFWQLAGRLLTLVVFCETKEDAEQSVVDLKKWLSQKGLTLSDEKTRIIHLTEGFNFLGFNARHYKVSNTKTGWKLLIKQASRCHPGNQAQNEEIVAQATRTKY